MRLDGNHQTLTLLLKTAPVLCSESTSINAVNANYLCYQFWCDFPSRTSRVRSIPALDFLPASGAREVVRCILTVGVGTRVQNLSPSEGLNPCRPWNHEVLHQGHLLKFGGPFQRCVIVDGDSLGQSKPTRLIKVLKRGSERSGSNRGSTARCTNHG